MILTTGGVNKTPPVKFFVSVQEKFTKMHFNYSTKRDTINHSEILLNNFENKLKGEKNYEKIQ